jgi:hypothetical protein
MKKSNSVMLLSALLSTVGADSRAWGAKVLRQAKTRHARYNTGQYRPHQGKQECARRVKQLHHNANKYFARYGVV